MVFCEDQIGSPYEWLRSFSGSEYMLKNHYSLLFQCFLLKEGLTFNNHQFIYRTQFFIHEMKETINVLWGKAESISTQIWNKTNMSIFTILIKYCTGSLASRIRERKERKGIRIGKEKLKISKFADDMMLYMKT